MGSPEAATPEENDGACYMDARNIDATARRNRTTLAAALTSVGMVNYPTEWWTGQRTTFTGRTAPASALPLWPCQRPEDQRAGDE